MHRHALVAPGFVAAAAYLLTHVPLIDLALTHLHNAAALVLWLTLFRRRPGWAALPLGLAVAAAALLLSGAGLSWTAQEGGLTAFGLRAAQLAPSFAPGLPPRLGVSLTMAFVFLQSVHYAVWTGWIPQDCLLGEGTPSFRMSAPGSSAPAPSRRSLC